MSEPIIRPTAPRAVAPLWVTLALAPLLLTTGAAAQAHLNLPGSAGPAWLLCDSLSTPETLVIGTPGKTGNAVVTILNHFTGTYAFSTWKVGAANAAAGSVYYPLTAMNGTAGARDALRVLNPGVTSDPTLYAFTPPLVSVTLQGSERTCRLVPGVRVLGVTERRTVLVTQDRGGRLTYQAFDYTRLSAERKLPGDPTAQTSGPSVRVTGGQVHTSGVGVNARTAYSFSNQGVQYEVRVAGGQGSVTVLEAGRVAQREGFQAFITGRAGTVK
ncbi:hypothetical protein [Deinococcus pimensis]|uniref:hypothetical protein n=1 Tax=Deinococcus pimensis TaxID=309888 RepID=UPI00048066A9|nr:hypothetical protein [Deinococcus pimensis]